MQAAIVFLAAITVLFHISASRAFSIKSQKEDKLDAGHESRITQVPEDIYVLSEGLDRENLMLIKENIGNNLHNIRKRHLSRRQSNEENEESTTDKLDERYRHVLFTKGGSFLESMKDKISDFMKPILDRIKHKPNEANQDTSPDPPADSFESSNSTISSNSSSILAPSPISECTRNERQRSMETLSLLFPDTTSDQGRQSFAFVPFANALIRAVEQEAIRESQHEDEYEGSELKH